MIPIHSLTESLSPYTEQTVAYRTWMEALAMITPEYRQCPESFDSHHRAFPSDGSERASSSLSSSSREKIKENYIQGVSEGFESKDNLKFIFL